MASGSSLGGDSGGLDGQPDGARIFDLMCGKTGQEIGPNRDLGLEITRPTVVRITLRLVSPNTVSRVKSGFGTSTQSCIFNAPSAFA